MFDRDFSLTRKGYMQRLESMNRTAIAESYITEARMRGKQKDWIIGNFQTGDLWCLSWIYSPMRRLYFLREYVVHFGLPKDKFGEMYVMGMQTMLDAMKEGDYEYVIADHRFTREQYMERPYWGRIREKVGSADGKYSLEEGKHAIDPIIFEKEVRDLVPNYAHTGVSLV